MQLQLRDFSYQLPEELIAQTPAIPRDSARLMVIRRATGEISHHRVSDLPALLPPDFDIVVNNSRVFPARLYAHKVTGGKVELLLLKKLSGDSYECIASPGLALGQKLVIRPDVTATVTAVDDRVRTLQFSVADPLLTELLAQIGTMPTPPYIKRLLENSEDYQTVYAKLGFSAAAPTAGLHFTPELIAKLCESHDWHEITLNVGLGTFLPVQEADVTTHHMHTEDYSISPETAAAIMEGKQHARRVLAVGTTTVRTLESNCALQRSGLSTLTPGNFSTNIFIYPPYHYQLTDALLTNFHLPESTLLMLVAAFVSAPTTDTPFTTFADSLIGRAYQLAIQEKYRFFSFGDAMLIL